MNSQYTRTTSPQLPDNSPSTFTLCSICHLHFFTCRYARPKWHKQGYRKTDRESKNYVLFACYHTAKIVKFALVNVEKCTMIERDRRRILSRCLGKARFF